MGLASRLMQGRFLTSLEGIRQGRLRLTTPEGRIHHFGDEGHEVELHIHDWAVLSRMAARGDVGLGEAWIDGQWSTPSLEALLTLAIRNLDHLSEWANAGILSRLRMRITDQVLRLNSLRGSSRNIRAHYDVGNEFYQLWLDPGMTYSSAIFAPGEDDLEQAQSRKNEIGRASCRERV